MLRIQSSARRPADDRGGGDGVGGQTGPRGDADRAPHRIRRPASARVQNVVHQSVPASPPAANVLDVASAAPEERTELAGSSSASWTSTCQPPSGAGPAVAMSPPRLTSTPLPVASWTRAGAVVRGDRLGRGPEIEQNPGRHGDDAIRRA